NGLINFYCNFQVAKGSWYHEAKINVIAWFDDDIFASCSLDNNVKIYKRTAKSKYLNIIGLHRNSNIIGLDFCSKDTVITAGSDACCRTIKFEFDC
ncbi:hypothetical protein A3Q56_02743, partial [Intoshia linei]